MLKCEFLETLKEYDGSYMYLAKKNKISASVATKWLCEEEMYKYLNLPEKNLGKYLLQLISKWV